MPEQNETEKLPQDALSEYVEEVEQLRNRAFYFIVAATVAPDENGAPVVIPMMLGDGLDRAKQQVLVANKQGVASVAERPLNIQTAFIQCLGELAKFGFGQQGWWEGCDKQALAIQVLRAMQPPCETGGESEKKIVQP